MDTAMNPKVGIIGSGLIGRSWAMLFAAGGFRVSLYDAQPDAVGKALGLIKQQLQSLKDQGLLRGSSTVDEQFNLISEAHSLEDCITNSVYVQECTPEDLELKRRVFKEIDEALDDDKTIIASSSSCIPASQFSEGLKHRSQVLIAHPVNPPYFVPLVEIVPAPWTRPELTTEARRIQEAIGQSPVVLKKEVPGFALNRVQYSILNECWRLVQDDLLSPEDVDRVMKDGLGPRYAFMGPFETIHLNAEGSTSYLYRYGETIWNVSQTFGPTPRMVPDSDVGKMLEEVMLAKIPIEELEARRQWRDARLADLAKMKAADKEYRK